MERLSWVGPRREKVLSEGIPRYQDRPTTQQVCRVDQRSDGVLFFMVWDIEKKPDEVAWEAFLTQEVSVDMRAPMGYLDKHEWPLSPVQIEDLRVKV